ncbi:transmembrane GTPase FZO [Spatholobus suberectus]|nr:transmembrane GTPase FZO [Spatholobus suberectus]
MVPCSVTAPSSTLPATAIIPRQRHTSFPRPPPLPLRRARASPVSSLSNGSGQFNQQLFRPGDPPQPRTPLPGGYKRPELKVPTLVLQLDPDEVLARDNDALALIDKAVSRWVGIVVLATNEASGGKLYEAACSLKSLLRDRAYLLVAERVDIAAAAAASGVLLSDQGLPTVVARNTMLDSKSELVVLPLVARIVHTVDAAVNASKSEGADFLIYGGADLKRVGSEVGYVYKSVKIPIFVSCGKNNVSYADALGLLASGASGFVTSLENFGLFGDEFLHKVLALCVRMLVAGMLARIN